MEAIINRTFSDADLDATCDSCQKQLPGAAQLWTIDNDQSSGFFCSKDCAELEIEKLEVDSDDAEKEKYLVTLALESSIHDYLDTMSEVDAVTTATDQEPQILLVTISARKASLLAKIDPNAEVKPAPAGEYIDYDTDRVVMVGVLAESRAAPDATYCTRCDAKFEHPLSKENKLNDLGDYGWTIHNGEILCDSCDENP